MLVLVVVKKLYHQLIRRKEMEKLLLQMQEQVLLQ
jgi:hypothetical protein